MAYMFSYYGLAAAAMLSVLNYCLLGLSFEVDGYYLKSFEIWLACMVVFPGAGNVAFTLLEYRIGHRHLLSAVIENITWIPFLYVFFFPKSYIYRGFTLLPPPSSAFSSLLD